MSWYLSQLACTCGKLFLKLKVKLQESKPVPSTNPKSVTQGNLKAIKRPSHGDDFIEWEHYFKPLPFSKRFCTSFSVLLYLSRNPNLSNILFAQTFLERQRQSRTSLIPLMHHLGWTQWTMNSIPTTSTKSLHQTPGQPVPEAKPLAPVWAAFCSRRP